MSFRVRVIGILDQLLAFVTLDEILKFSEPQFFLWEGR